MPDEIQVGSPQHEALRAEYGEALKSGDQARIEQVGAKYSQLAGGKQQVDVSGGVQAGPPRGGDGTDESYIAESVAESDRVLRAELGDQFDATIQQARETAISLVMDTFKGDGVKAEQVLDSLMAGILMAGGSALEMNRLMIAINKRTAKSSK